MAAVADDTLRFKFRWLDEQGNETGFLRKHGSFDGETLVLDDAGIPAAVILQAETVEQRMVISVLSEDDQPATVAISLANVGAKELKSSIDIARSATWAGFEKERLEEEGRGHAYRDELCTQCGATLILTDMPRTPQLFCHFCDSLTTFEHDGQVLPGEHNYKICEECGMFSKPRKFTIFYFYFLLVVYGFSKRTTWRCPACMRGDAWKMFFGNLLFVVGVPVAIVQLIRSYGGSIITGPAAGLDSANLKARKHDILGALKLYRAILDRVPHVAGVKYNVGLALWEQNETSRAAESFRLALDDCGNYVPAFHALAACYEELGEKEKLAELNAMWGTDEEDDEELDEDM